MNREEVELFIRLSHRMRAKGGKWLKDTRQAHGIGLRQLSLALDISPTNLCKYERGAIPLTVRVAQKFLDYLQEVKP